MKLRPFGGTLTVLAALGLSVACGDDESGSDPDGAAGAGQAGAPASPSGGSGGAPVIPLGGSGGTPTSGGTPGVAGAPGEDAGGAGGLLGSAGHGGSSEPVDDPNCVKTYLQPTNAVASSEEDTAKKAEFVKDRDMDTRWSSKYEDDEWIYLDLGSAQKLNRVELYFEAAFTKHYQIQGSNNVEADQWFFLAEVENGNGGKDIVNFEPREARYVRMYAIKRGSVWGNSLWEFQPYLVDCSAGQGGAGGQGAGGKGGAGGAAGASGSAGHPSG